MTLPNDLRYSASHEWTRVNDDGTLTIGITEYAQEQLGDVVFVETPEMDRSCAAEEAIAVVESVKAASDLYAPVAGKVIDTNAELTESPELINDSPYDKGWIFKILPDDVESVETLLDADAYKALTETD